MQNSKMPKHSTLTFAGYNLIFGLVLPAIDNAAHVGGFLTGGAMGWLTAMPRDPSVRAMVAPRKLGVALLTLGSILAVGVAVLPRYNYSVRDESRWSETIAVYTEKEYVLLSRFNAEMEQWQRSTAGGAAFARFVDNELVPFYRDYQDRVQALKLSPDRETGKHREVLARFIQLRLKSYQVRPYYPQEMINQNINGEAVIDFMSIPTGGLKM